MNRFNATIANILIFFIPINYGMIFLKVTAYQLLLYILINTPEKYIN